MSKIEHLQEEVAGLTSAERAAFAEWFEEFQAQEWDKQIEADSLAGRLDALAEKAREDHRAGRTRPL